MPASHLIPPAVERQHFRLAALRECHTCMWKAATSALPYEAGKHRSWLHRAAWRPVCCAGPQVLSLAGRPARRPLQTTPCLRQPCLAAHPRCLPAAVWLLEEEEEIKGGHIHFAGQASGAAPACPQGAAPTSTALQVPPARRPSPRLCETGLPSLAAYAGWQLWRPPGRRRGAPGRRAGGQGNSSAAASTGIRPNLRRAGSKALQVAGPAAPLPSDPCCPAPAGRAVCL